MLNLMVVIGKGMFAIWETLLVTYAAVGYKEERKSRG